MQVSTAAEPGAAAQDRPTAARSPRRLVLGRRLTIAVTVAAAAVTTLITFGGIRLAERQLENDLRETGEITAFAVADDIELRQQPLDGEPLLPVLQSFINAAPDLRSITVYGSTDGRPEVVVSTSAVMPPPVGLVRDVISSGEVMTARPTADTLLVAVPIASAQTIGGAVAVVVSAGAIRRLERAALIVAFGGDLFAILAVAALMTLLARLRDRNEELLRSYQSVSQLRETAARAQQLAAVGQTMANVAHQIGTPLNLVSGHVQLLQNEITDPAIQRRLSIVEQQVERVVAAVHSLLERARPRGDRHPVRIESIIARIGDAMRARLATSGVALSLDIREPLRSVAADEGQLELALMNLVTNALDAMPDGGTLTLAAANTGSGVRIDVRDTGSGVDPSVLPRMFEPWVTTKPAGRGTGLGLSITRDLVTSLGGAIHVTTNPGKGTTFTIELPCPPAS